jgi:tRNA (Thr-GGU) A37 N-methylase
LRRCSEGLPKDLLAGLDEYSHCWVIYVFHANTNLGDTRNGGTVKAGLYRLKSVA